MSTTTKTRKPAADKSKDKDKVHKLSLKGSSKLVAEFVFPSSLPSAHSSPHHYRTDASQQFEYSINSILFQRGVYPAEDFTAVKKYGLNMLVTADDDVKAYIRRIMSQLSRWLLNGKISKLVVVITSKETGENLERWQFDVQLLQKQRKPSHPDEAPMDIDGENTAAQKDPTREKTEKEIQEEIQSLFRQITASVTFLPMLDGRCTFNVLVYADGDAEVPMEWGDSDAKEIDGGEKVTLRSWGTSSHKVDTLVSYRLAE